MPAMTGYKRTRYIERDHRSYDLRALVDELRQEARVSWHVMHQFRKQAAAESDGLRRCDYERMALTARAQLLSMLNLLNVGLGRSGSYTPTYLRRLSRDVAEIRARVAA